MSFILSLIAGRSATEIGNTQLDQASAACERAGSPLGGWRWLEHGRAVECDLTMASPELLAEVRKALGQAPIDANLTPGSGTERRKRVLVCDMDATAIEGETLDDLSTFTPYKAEIDALTRRSVEGSMSFADTLVQRVAMLTGLDLDAFERAHALVRPSPGVRTLVATMRGQGALTALVSGGFRFFTKRIRDELGFEIDIANELEIEHGRLTGRLACPVVGPEAKVAAVGELARRAGARPGAVLAVGDGANDIGMLEAAGLGVAYRGKAKVRALIAHQINHADLTALLFLQGYHRDEFRVLPDRR